MPWAIKIVNFSEKFKKDASYEPELHPGVTYKLKVPKATLKIFSTGSITVTGKGLIEAHSAYSFIYSANVTILSSCIAASVANVQAAIEHIFPLVYEFRKKRTPDMVEQMKKPPAEPEEVVEETSDIDDVDSGTNKKGKQQGVKRKYPFGFASNDPSEDIMAVSDEDIDDDEDL